MEAVHALPDRQLRIRQHRPRNSTATNVTKISDWCFYRRDGGGKEGGSFTVGGVTVPLNKKINDPGWCRLLQDEEKKPTEGHVFPAEGAETLEAPELTVPKGINLITPAIHGGSQLAPQRLTESFDYAKLHKETKLFAEHRAGRRKPSCTKSKTR